MFRLTRFRHPRESPLVYQQKVREVNLGTHALFGRDRRQHAIAESRFATAYFQSATTRAPTAER